MDFDKKYAGKLAAGFYLDNNRLYFVCLGQKGKSVELVHAESVQLNSLLSAVAVGEDLIGAGGLDFDDDGNFDLTSDSGDDAFLNHSDNSDSEDSAIIASLLNQLPAKNIKAGVSLPEPFIYYTYFYSDWGLSGKKLKDKVIEELAKQRSEEEPLSPDSLFLMKLADGRVLAIVRDQDVNLFGSLQEIRRQRLAKVPQLQFVETAEMSLINLVNQHYDIDEKEITVIINVGNESSRLIFLQGHEIYNISYIIGAGIDSDNVCLTIYSRILLEQDNLNLHQIDHIILTGEARKAGLKNLLINKFQDKINIDLLELREPGIHGIDEYLSEFAVAIGAATRVLEGSSDRTYDVDLMPPGVREEQKVFKLGVVGWFLLIMIPVLAFFATMKMIQQEERLEEARKEFRIAKTLHEELQPFAKQHEQITNKLASYEQAVVLVDSLMSGTKDGSTFIRQLSSAVGKSAPLWLTEFARRSNGSVIIKGYSLYRNRIPRFAKLLPGEVSLNRVEVIEIREREVYQFQLTTKPVK